MRTQDLSATTRNDSNQHRASVFFRRPTPRYAISFLVLLIVIVGLILHDVRTDYQATLARWDVQLSGSADDRVKASALWLKERRTDTFSVAGNHDAVHFLSTAPGSDVNLPEIRKNVEQSIARVAALNGFLGGALGDRDCRIVLQVGLRPEMVRGIQAACQAAQQAGEFRVDTSGADQGHVWLDLAAPVVADGESSASGQSPRRMVGSAIMVTENWRDIFPIFASEGLPAPASETLIVWKKGDDANVFSPRLNAQGGESFFRRPLNGPTFESHVARDGDVPFGEFLDYRGERVLGVARRIGVANYSLVRKVDYDAALAEQRRRAALEKLLGALSVLLFGIVMVALHRDAAARDWKDRVRQDEALHKSQALTNAIVNSTSDMIWSVDPETFSLLTFNRGLADYYLHWRGIHLRTGMPQEDLFADQDYIDRWRTLYQRALTEGSFTTDYRVSAGPNILQLTFNLLQRDGKVFGISIFGKDITERKAMEESLKESEERYRRLFEVESDAILVVDVKTCRLMDANPAALKMYGYSREEFQSLTAPEVSAEPETTRVAIAEGQAYIPVRWHRKKDGTVFPVEITGNFFFNQGRRIHVAAIRDITDRQRAEEALQLTQFSMEHASDGIYWVDPIGRILYVNEAACRSLEYSRDELLSLSISDIDPLFPRETWGVRWEQTKRLGSMTFETQHRARTGTIFAVEMTVNYLEFSGKEYNFAFVRNISERKRIEQALTESERRYRDFIEHSKEGVWRLEFDQPIPVDLPQEEIVERVLRYGYVAECNLAYARDIGFSTPEEIVGKHLGELFPLSDQERWASYRVSAEGGLMARTVEYRSRDGSDKFRHFLRAEVPIIQNGMLIRLWGITRDITELREAEISLRESEERFRATFENAGVGMALMDLQGHPLKSNPALRQMLGYSEEELMGMDFTQFTHPDDRELDWRLYGELAAGQRDNYEIEKRYLKKDGSLMWGQLTVSLVRRGQGGPVHGVAMVQDITERKRAAEALRENEERFRSLVENNTVGIYRTTPQGLVLMANSALIRMLGYANFEALAARNLEDAGFEPGYPREVFRERMARDGEVRGLEERWKRQDGSVIFVRESARAVRSPEGKTLYYDGVVEDITGEKEAEAEHVRLVAAIEQSAEAVVVTNPAGEIEYVNPAFTRITGYSRAEVLGHTPRVLKSGQHEPEFYQHFWQTILEGQPWHGEVFNKRKDGSLYTELMTVTPVRGEHGEITHFIATKQDVTERRALEAQLHQAAKMEAVGRLAGGVSHDFNNLLTVINGYSEILREMLASNPTASGYLKEINDAGERAASLTRQLLAYSRRQVLTPQVLDLNVVVSNLENMLRRLIGEDIMLHTLLNPVGRVKADPGQIEQVIMNLAVNARDAMPQGGHLTLETRIVELDEDYARNHPTVKPGPHVMLAVGDTGAGMTPETRARIFEPFFTTKEMGKGTGLGLATVYGIVKQSGGSVWVYSELGQGTVLKIYLPMVSDSLAPGGQVKLETDSASGTETILVVEDEDAVRSLVRLALVSGGYKVLETPNAESALKICANHDGPIHLLLTDVVMPQMSGPVAASKIAALRPGIRVLYMSGYTDDAVVHHGVLSQEMPFIQKPFSPVVLRKKIRDVLSGNKR